mmetsp:Transcript_1254/g.2610  ORF Transcript_1254/g.2610 Transcript_1254/m.2610 type:complete len:511 (-) Transcript_1254:82-1614(-)
MNFLRGSAEHAAGFVKKMNQVADTMSAKHYKYMFYNASSSSVRILLEEDPEGMLQAAKNEVDDGIPVVGERAKRRAKEIDEAHQNIIATAKPYQECGVIPESMKTVYMRSPIVRCSIAICEWNGSLKIVQVKQKLMGDDSVAVTIDSAMERTSRAKLVRADSLAEALIHLGVNVGFDKADFVTKPDAVMKADADSTSTAEPELTQKARQPPLATSLQQQQQQWQQQQLQQQQHHQHQQQGQKQMQQQQQQHENGARTSEPTQSKPSMAQVIEQRQSQQQSQPQKLQKPGQAQQSQQQAQMTWSKQNDQQKQALPAWSNGQVQKSPEKMQEAWHQQPQFGQSQQPQQPQTQTQNTPRQIHANQIPSSQASPNAQQAPTQDGTLKRPMAFNRDQATAGGSSYSTSPNGRGGSSQEAARKEVPRPRQLQSMEASGAARAMPPLPEGFLPTAGQVKVYSTSARKWVVGSLAGLGLGTHPGAPAGAACVQYEVTPGQVSQKVLIAEQLPDMLRMV